MSSSCGVDKLKFDYLKWPEIHGHLQPYKLHLFIQNQVGPALLTMRAQEKLGMAFGSAQFSSFGFRFKTVTVIQAQGQLTSVLRPAFAGC